MNRIVYSIEDERHAETISRHHNFAAAQVELRRIVGLPWDENPNRAPCTNWRKCGRTYLIRGYDESAVPWGLVSTIPGPEVDAEGGRWPDEDAP